MTAAITDDSYNQQVTSIFDFLKSASPQQLAQVSQAVQQNPQSPEATALAMATNYQQQMRSGQAQAPQQTVYQKHIAQLLQSIQPPAQPAPMQSGIAAAGPNQYALQAAATQDPMRNAGIGAAPENTPTQQAATGGLVALAHGGSVRGFSGLDGSYAVPELGSYDAPEEEEESEAADERQPAEDQYDEDTGEPVNQHVQYKDVPKTRIPRQDGPDLHTPAPGSSAAQAQKKSATDAVKKASNELLDVYGPSYSISPDLLSKLDKMQQGATRDKWIGALASGIGNLLSAQTPYMSQAVGQGLIGGLAGYQQGAKEEGDIEKQTLQLQMAAEKEAHADKRSAVNSILAQQAATLKAQRERELEMDKLKAKGYTDLQVASILAGRGAAGNVVDPNERSQRIKEAAQQIASSSQALQEAWSPDRIRLEAERQVDAEMARAPSALKGVNPAPYNPLQAYGFIGGPLGGR